MGTPARNGRFNGRKPGQGKSTGNTSNASNTSNRGGKSSAEHQILFQDYFKSVGPRTYAAQVKKANNGNHYLVLTEGKRDEATNEVWKTRLFVYSEDFPAFFRMMKAASEFIKDHPVAPEVAKKRKAYWAKNAGADAAPPATKASPEDAGDAGDAGSAGAATARAPGAAAPPDGTPGQRAPVEAAPV